MGFETLTLAPIDRRLVLPELLSAQELAWLDAYHARVREMIGPELGPADRAWLDAATAPIGEVRSDASAAVVRQAHHEVGGLSWVCEAREKRRLRPEPVEGRRVLPQRLLLARLGGAVRSNEISALA